MTVKEYKARQVDKLQHETDEFQNYITNFKECADVFNQKTKQKLQDRTGKDFSETTPFIIGKILAKKTMDQYVKTQI